MVAVPRVGVGSCRAIVSYSTDGISWETGLSTDTEAITGITTMGDTLILVGEDLVTHVWNAP